MTVETTSKLFSLNRLDHCQINRTGTHWWGRSFDHTIPQHDCRRLTSPMRLPQPEHGWPVLPCTAPRSEFGARELGHPAVGFTLCGLLDGLPQNHDLSS
jgi:hypothetical protein